MELILFWSPQIFLDNDGTYFVSIGRTPYRGDDSKATPTSTRTRHCHLCIESACCLWLAPTPPCHILVSSGTDECADVREQVCFTRPMQADRPARSRPCLGTQIDAQARDQYPYSAHAMCPRTQNSPRTNVSRPSLARGVSREPMFIRSFQRKQMCSPLYHAKLRVLYLFSAPTFCPLQSRTPWHLRPCQQCIPQVTLRFRTRLARSGRVLKTRVANPGDKPYIHKRA